MHASDVRQPARKPGKGDVSRPDPSADYRAKKRFYQDPAVARIVPREAFEG